MEDNNESKKNINTEEFLEILKKQRLQLRILIKEIIEETIGRELKIEDDLSGILKSLPKDQQESVISKLTLAQTFPENKE
ncbi:MAG: hypothetical protein MK207_01895 [Saprospiraceae bacterium]|nr:hypothetical protein [Saprospiraceae bacterium]